MELSPIGARLRLGYRLHVELSGQADHRAFSVENDIGIARPGQEKLFCATPTEILSSLLLAGWRTVDDGRQASRNFIKRYLTAYERWNSPKFLFGDKAGRTARFGS
jgi:hypothetical protein